MTTTKIIKPEHEDQEPLVGYPKLFLAGSIDNGTAEPWQPRAEAAFSDLEVTIFNPRRENWDAALKQDISDPVFAYQVNWELDRMDQSDVLLFYFSPAGPAPITLMEIGTLAYRKDFRAVVCCPPGYWRRGNVQIMCSRLGIALVDTLEEAFALVRAEILAVLDLPAG
jgi:hypothetical protein